jgi:hypothetical protein
MAEVCGGAEGALTESPALQPNSIPDNMSNRECILVLERFDTDAIIKGQAVSLRTTPTRSVGSIHQLRGRSQMIPGTKNAGQVREQGEPSASLISVAFPQEWGCQVSQTGSRVVFP